MIAYWRISTALGILGLLFTGCAHTPVEPGMPPDLLLANARYFVNQRHPQTICKSTVPQHRIDARVLAVSRSYPFVVVLSAGQRDGVQLGYRFVAEKNTDRDLFVVTLTSGRCAAEVVPGDPVPEIGERFFTPNIDDAVESWRKEKARDDDGDRR